MSNVVKNIKPKTVRSRKNQKLNVLTVVKYTLQTQMWLDLKNGRIKKTPEIVLCGIMHSTEINDHSGHILDSDGCLMLKLYNAEIIFTRKSSLLTN